MADSVSSQQRFAAAGQAWQKVEQWSAGAQALAALTALHRQGWTRLLTTPREIDALTDLSGLPPARLKDVLDVLQTHGVVTRDGTLVHLSGPFEALAADDAWIGIDDVLDHAEVMTRLVREAARPAVTAPLSESDALVVARAAGGRTTTVTVAMFEQLLADLPEWPEAMREGRRLDVGGGVATTALTLAKMFPRMRTTAIEVVPLVAAEAVRRAKSLEVADRVDVLAMDARDFTEQDAFDSAFWAQPFFPEPTRAATLATIRRALRPGGLLSMQEADAAPEAAERRAHALRRLVHRGWQMPFGRTAEQLAAEAEAAGFEPHRIAATGFGRFVLMRRPAD